MDRLECAEDLEKMVLKIGFLPFFKNSIEGFSVEEHTPEEYWFVDDREGPWEWKSNVVVNGRCVYGKLFHGKAGFVSLDWFHDLMNIRRKEVKLTNAELKILNLIKENESLLTPQIKKLGGYVSTRKSKDISNVFPFKAEEKQQVRQEGFDTIMSHLQMSTHIIIADFEYNYRPDGERYGFGVARYTTPEAMFGEELISKIPNYSSTESKKLIITQILNKYPHYTRADIQSVL